jgi:SagB-type dehydrogenase family enzyme
MSDNPTAQSPFVRLGFPKEESLAESYHENTKLHPYHRWGEDDPSGAGAEFGEVASLTYVPPGEAGRVALPDLAQGPESTVSVEQAILARRSRRAFTGEPVTLAQLAKLLGLTYGVTGATEPSGAPGRAAPSAGARFPLELYVVAQRVEGLAPALYHYHPETHALEVVEARDVSVEVRDALFDQPFLENAAFVLLVGAVFTRTLVKYGDRGYRLVLLDAGHAVENLYLAATAMGLGVTGLGGFLDDALNTLVKLNGEDENVVCCAAVGRLPEGAT